MACLPPGRFAVGVSGGADSVALLRLTLDRGDLHPHVVHLDHQTRGQHSTADADFVAALADRFKLPLILARLDELQPPATPWPTNRSARFRAMRLSLYRRAVASHDLDGVLLAHHADDQAETIVQRLLRGSGPSGLTGMRPVQKIAGLSIARPLLPVRAAALRDYLRHIDQPWREDASNESDAYARNRARRWLRHHPALFQPLIELGQAATAWQNWIESTSPRLADTFAVQSLQEYPHPVQVHALRQWLVNQGSPRSRVQPDVVDRLLEMVSDAASPARRQFPGPLSVRRRRGIIFIDGTSCPAH